MRVFTLTTKLLATLLFLFGGSSWSQEQNPFFTNPEADGLACIDTEPLDDGFGWNGTCGCRVGQISTPFLRSFHDDLVLYSSSETPSGCSGSGSIFVASRRMGDWEQVAELNSAFRTAHDGFPGETVVSGNTIVGTGNPRPEENNPAYLSIFESEDGINWSETQTIFREDPTRAFADVKIEEDVITYWSQVRVEGTDLPEFKYFLHVIEKRAIGDWQESAKIELQPQGFGVSRLSIKNGVIAAYSSLSDNKQIDLYEKQNGDWRLQSSIALNNGWPNTRFDFNGDTIFLIGQTLVKGSDGTWTVFENNAFPVADSYGQFGTHYTPFHNGALAPVGTTRAVMMQIPLDDSGEDCRQNLEICSSRVLAVGTYTFRDDEWKFVDEIILDFDYISGSSGTLVYNENEILVVVNRAYSKIFKVDDLGNFISTGGTTATNSINPESTESTSSDSSDEPDSISGSDAQSVNTESLVLDDATMVNTDTEEEQQLQDTSSIIVQVDDSANGALQNTDNDNNSTLNTGSSSGNAGGGSFGISVLVFLVFLISFRRSGHATL